MSGDILRIRNLMQYGERKLINFPRDSERLRGFGLADKDAEQPSITIIFSLLFAEDQNKISFFFRSSVAYLAASIVQIL